MTISTIVLLSLTSYWQTGQHEQLTGPLNNICGQIALATVSEYLGRKDALDAVFDELPATGSPKSFAELILAADRLGLKTSAIRWSVDVPANFMAPAIVRINRGGAPGGVGHFVSVLRAINGRCLVLDSPKNPYWTEFNPSQPLWDGVALHFANHEAKLPRPHSIKHVVVVLCGMAFGLASLFLFDCTFRDLRTDEGDEA